MAAARPASFSSLASAGVLAGVLALGLSGFGARASEPASAPAEPPISFGSLEAALEARLRLTLAAEAEPAFFRLLLNSAKAGLERAREDAQEARAAALNDGGAFEPWSFELQDETRFSGARAISVLRRISEYDGGAEIRARLESYAFDRAAKKPLTLADLFEDLSAESPAMALLRGEAVARLAPLKAERLRISEAEAREALTAALPSGVRGPRLFSFAPSRDLGAVGGLTLHFGPHEIGAGEEGEYEATIPQEAFRDLLAEEWRDAFSGEPLALTRLQSQAGFSGAVYGLAPGATVSAPLTVRGEASRAFFREGAGRLDLAPEHGGLPLARARVRLLEEEPAAGAAEDAVVFEATLKDLRATRAGAPLNLRLLAGPGPDDALAPDRMVLRLVAGEAAPEEPKAEEAKP